MPASACSSNSPISTSTRIVASLGVALLSFPGKVYSTEISAPYEARLTQHSGDVVIRTRDAQAEGPPYLGVTPLDEGDWVMVGKGKSVAADISFTNGTMIRVLENSAVRLKRITEKDTLLVLAYGTLLAKVEFQKGWGYTFRVQSPNGIATVRGTEFVVEDVGSRAWIGVLDEGHVAATVSGFKKEVVMHFNQETVVQRGLPPKNAGILDHLYHYKTPMAEMRSRIRRVRKNWKATSWEQRQHLRALWIRRNPSPAVRRSRHKLQSSPIPR